MNTQPLIEINVGFRHRAVGFPKKTRALFFKDHIELYNNKGENILNKPLNELQGLALGRGYIIRFKVDGHQHSLDFTPMPLEIFLGCFGMLGQLLASSTLNPGNKIAKHCVSTLQQNGVQIQIRPLIRM